MHLKKSGLSLDGNEFRPPPDCSALWGREAGRPRVAAHDFDCV